MTKKMCWNDSNKKKKADQSLGAFTDILCSKVFEVGSPPSHHPNLRLSPQVLKLKSESWLGHSKNLKCASNQKKRG